MNRRKFIVLSFNFLAGFLLGCHSELKAEVNYSKEENDIYSSTRIERDFLEEHIHTLTSLHFGGRRTGTQEEANATLYVVDLLQKFQISPKGENNTYFQQFPVREMGLTKKNNRTIFYTESNKITTYADNIIGVIKSVNNSEKHIVLSAHLDHLGIWKSNLYPGANDNASGVATVLEMARVLNLRQQELPCSIIIAFFSGEEMGLLGSNYFFKTPTFSRSDIILNINLDTVGNGKEGEFIYWTNNNLAEEICKELNSFDNLIIEKDIDKNHSSDHKSFCKKNIPAFTILSDKWLEYNHTPQDTKDIINFTKIENLGQSLVDYLLSASFKSKI